MSVKNAYGRTGPWEHTHEYTLAVPLTQNKISRPLQLVLLLLKSKSYPNRKNILEKLKLERTDDRGRLTCMFTILNTNKIIHYDKKAKCYVRGERYKEYLKFCLDYIEKRNLKETHKKIYENILMGISPAIHFIKN